LIACHDHLAFVLCHCGKNVNVEFVGVPLQAAKARGVVFGNPKPTPYVIAPLRV
jgi:hypothetical protein